MNKKQIYIYIYIYRYRYIDIDIYIYIYIYKFEIIIVDIYAAPLPPLCVVHVSYRHHPVSLCVCVCLCVCMFSSTHMLPGSYCIMKKHLYRINDFQSHRASPAFRLFGIDVIFKIKLLACLFFDFLKIVKDRPNVIIVVKYEVMYLQSSGIIVIVVYRYLDLILQGYTFERLISGIG